MPQTAGSAEVPCARRCGCWPARHLIITTRGVAGGSFVAHPSPAQLSEASRPASRCCRRVRWSVAEHCSRCGRSSRYRPPGSPPNGAPRSSWPRCEATLFDPQTADASRRWSRCTTLFHGRSRRLRQPAARADRPSAARGVERLRLPDTLTRADWVRVDADHRAILGAVAGRDAPAAAEAAAGTWSSSAHCSAGTPDPATATRSCGRSSGRRSSTDGRAGPAGHHRRRRRFRRSMAASPASDRPVTSAAWAVSTCQAKDCSPGRVALSAT